MKAQLWAFLTTTKYRVLYATCYRRTAYLINNCINAATLLVSASSIAGWAIWSNLGILWSLLIATSQVLQVIKPLLPFTDRLNALKYYIPETSHLYLEVEFLWNTLNHYTEEELAKQLLTLQDKYQRIDDRYLGTIDLPDRNWIHAKVKPDFEFHFQPFYQRQPEEVNHDGQDAQATSTSFKA